MTDRYTPVPPHFQPPDFLNTSDNWNAFGKLCNDAIRQGLHANNDKLYSEFTIRCQIDGRDKSAALSVSNLHRFFPTWYRFSQYYKAASCKFLITIQNDEERKLRNLVEQLFAQQRIRNDIKIYLNGKPLHDKKTFQPREFLNTIDNWIAFDKLCNEAIREGLSVNNDTLYSEFTVRCRIDGRDKSAALSVSNLRYFFPIWDRFSQYYKATSCEFSITIQNDEDTALKNRVEQFLSLQRIRGDVKITLNEISLDDNKQYDHVFPLLYFTTGGGRQLSFLSELNNWDK